MNTIPWTLSRDAAGQLVYTGPDGQPHENIMAVRAFPIAAPGEVFHYLEKTVTNWLGFRPCKTCRKIVAT